jgi:hypothetical protein
MNRRRLKQVDILMKILAVCCGVFFICKFLFLKVSDHVWMSVFSFFLAVLIFRLVIAVAEWFPSRDNDRSR